MLGPTVLPANAPQGRAADHLFRSGCDFYNCRAQRRGLSTGDARRSRRRFQSAFDVSVRTSNDVPPTPCGRPCGSDPEGEPFPKRSVRVIAYSRSPPPTARPQFRSHVPPTRWPTKSHRGGSRPAG